MVHSARHGKWSALIFNIADPRSSHTASYELLSSYSSVHYDDASHGVHLESTVQRGPSLSSNFTKNPSKYNIKLCQMGRWWSNLVKGVKIWQFEGRFRKKNRLESLLQKEENYLPPLRWHRRWKWTRLNWEPNNSNLATRTDFKRLGARPWNIFFWPQNMKWLWKITEKLQKSLQKSFQDNLEVGEEIVCPWKSLVSLKRCKTIRIKKEFLLSNIDSGRKLLDCYKVLEEKNLLLFLKVKKKNLKEYTNC